MDEFYRDYRQVSETFGSAAAGQGVQGYVLRVEGAFDTLVKEMVNLADNQKGLDYAKGDVAEAWHAGTLTADAIRQHLNVRAFAPRDHSPIDVRVAGPSGTIDSQLKVYGSAMDTAKAISEPKYLGTDQKIVPSDQLDGVREAAARLAMKNHLTRLEMERNYSHTSRTADDHLHYDGANSKPISEKATRQMTQDARDTGDVDREGLGLTARQSIQWGDFIHEAGTAAMRAAALSAALQLAPHIVSLIAKAIKSGEITLEDLAPIGKQIPSAVFRSGVAGGLSASIVMASRMGVLSESLSNLDPTVVAAAVTLAMSAIGTSIKAARGDISWPIAAKTMMEDTFVLSCAIGGAAAVSQAIIPIPILGALIGNIVGALVARLVISQGNRTILGIAKDTGWTFFGIVDQNYAIPEDILLEGGWELMRVERLECEMLHLQRLELETLEMEPVPFRVLRRGVVSFGKIGYAV
jgi:hypothetical protein